MLVQGSSRSCGSFPLALQHQMAESRLVSAFLYTTGGTARPRRRQRCQGARVWGSAQPPPPEWCLFVAGLQDLGLLPSKNALSIPAVVFDERRNMPCKRAFNTEPVLLGKIPRAKCLRSHA